MKLPTPMEPIPWAAPFDDPDWLFQVKWDGIRGLSYSEGGVQRIYSRRGREITSQYPEIAGPPLFKKGVSGILDGELVVLDESGKPSFPLVLRRDRTSSALAVKEGTRRWPVLYMVFDLLELKGRSLADTPLRERLELLESHLNQGERILFSEAQGGDGVAFFTAVNQLGLEGMVAKAAASPYRGGKQHNYWKKIKCFREITCWVIGFTQKQPGAVASLVLAVEEAEDLRYAGRVGSGLSQKEAAEWMERLSPIRREGKGEEYFPVSPQYQVRVRYLEWTPELRLRAPSYLGIVNP